MSHSDTILTTCEVTMTSTIQIILIALGTGLLVGSLTAWWFTGNYKDTKFEAERQTHAAQVATIRADSAEKLLSAEREKSRIQGELQDGKNQLIEAHSARVASLSTTIADVSKLKLRDPGATSRPGSSTSTGNSSGTGSGEEGIAANGLLSGQATRFLWSFATEADGTLETLRTCQQWVEKVENASAEYQKSLTKPQAD